MTATRQLGLVLIDGFADWEYGLLPAAAIQWYGGVAVTVLTPGGSRVTSMAGLDVCAGSAVEMIESARFDAVAVIGADGWAAGEGPDIGGLLNGVHAGGGVIGAICGGTVAVARSGLFDGRRHTSNAGQWLRAAVGDYAGADLYQDTPKAVSDDRVISAPGTAPDTFAAAMLSAIFPDRTDQVGQMLTMLGAEHKG